MKELSITIDRNSNPSVLPPASDFYYVDQGNYQTLLLDEEAHPVIYSDSATSCIIVIVITRFQDTNSVTLAHVDSPECIEAFFKIISEQDSDSFRIYAQGANPSGNSTAEENAEQLKKSIEQLGTKVSSSDLFLLEGDPNQNNRGDFGFMYTGGGKATITNQPYTLQLNQRDPTCGGQTVYCIMRRQETPVTQIRNAGIPFTHAELVELASIALKYCKDESDPSTAFTSILLLENEQILHMWSTTPEYEAPWFSDQLKMGAAFAIAMAPVVSLSEHSLQAVNKPRFQHFRDALLR